MKKIFRFQILFSSFFLVGCKKADPASLPPFENAPSLFVVLPGVVDEASGIADSYSIPGYLWIHEDSGNPPQLHLMEHNGAHGKKIYLKGASNRDWEDMAIAGGPIASKRYLYIAETGDNSQTYDQYSIYRFEEPTKSMDTVLNFDQILFKYPDGSHDAEAILVDQSKNIFIITKRDLKSRVYKLSYPQTVNSVNNAELVMELPYNGVVSAAISTDQNEILVKTYSSIYYYRGNSLSVENMLKKAYETIPYQVEIQGEAIAFRNDNSGFYTLSEKNMIPSVKLNFYKRK